MLERVEQAHARARDEQDVLVGVFRNSRRRRTRRASLFFPLGRVGRILLGVLLLGRAGGDARDARERRLGASQVPRGDGLDVWQEMHQRPERRARALVPDRARHGARPVVVTRATGSALALFARRRRGRARGVRGVQRHQRV